MAGTDIAPQGCRQSALMVEVTHFVCIFETATQTNYYRPDIFMAP